MEQREKLYCLEIVSLDFVISWFMVVDVNFVLILIVPHVFVDFINNIDSEKPTKEESQKVIKKLIEEKKSIAICTKDNSPHSIQVEEVIAAANIFAIKKSLSKLSKEEGQSLTRWIQVFSNKTSLSLSFRETHKDFSPKFLKNSPDFDYGALGALVSICNKSEGFSQELTKAIVLIIITIDEYE